MLSSTILKMRGTSEASGGSGYAGSVVQKRGMWKVQTFNRFLPHHYFKTPNPNPSINQPVLAFQF